MGRAEVRPTSAAATWQSFVARLLRGVNALFTWPSSSGGFSQSSGRSSATAATGPAHSFSLSGATLRAAAGFVPARSTMFRFSHSKIKIQAVFLSRNTSHRGVDNIRK